eukprot:TRINITY_DN1724_c0_g2_i1.p1 TRINITY_DN1724_c0_g2~~TRINITY_DN1724_c0_g2_i1.p1  ORF type:complete len:103 (-),score=22.45 TRINITY_DN1724_c0_g2_i1:42-350(-)
MAPHEIWCNESQERYVMAVAAEDFARFEEICKRERAQHAVIGEATEELHLTVSDNHFDNNPVGTLPTRSIDLGKATKNDIVEVMYFTRQKDEDVKCTDNIRI